MATLMIQPLGPASTRRGARALDGARHRAGEELGGRLLWSAWAEPRGRARARRLAGLVPARPVELETLGEDDVRGVAGGDVVVLHDATATLVAPALRERGVHTVLDGVSAPHGSRGQVDAYLLAWRELRRGDVAVDCVAAVIPAAGLVAGRELSPATGDRTLAWSCVLADVVSSDRAETVGGTLGPRPVVALR